MTKIKISIVVFILLLGLIIRLHNYSVYPQRGASSDEYTYSFLGISLLTKHIPISWSAYTAYKNLQHLTIDNLYFPIVYPYFDHPPFAGIVVGGWSILFGEDTFLEVKLKTIRLVPIFLSTVSQALVFLLGWKIFNFKIGVWAVLIYSTTTIFAVNSRVVFAENVLTPLMLLSIYLFHILNKKLTVVKTTIISILCGFSFWTKELGIATFLTMLYFFISYKIKPKFLLLLVFISTLLILSYGLYGMYFDWEVFRKIISLQAGRDIGPRTLLYLISTPIIVNKVYFDGWYLFGIISFFLSFLDYNKNKILIIPSLIYFILLLFSLTEEGEMGWYMIPMFPFMAIFSARLLVESLTKQSLFILLMLLIVGLYNIRYLYEEPFGLTTFTFRLFLFVMFGPFILALLFNKRRFFRFLGNVWFYIFIVSNVFLTYNYIHPA